MATPKASGGNIITFFSLSTNKEFSFYSYLTDYTDQYNTLWTPTEIYGRMDNIQNYKNTIRSIKLSFDVPSYDLKEAKINLANSDLLLQSLYPIYNGSNQKGRAIIASPPMFRIKFGNLIYNSAKNVASNKAREDGLLGVIDGHAFKPEIDSGFFIEEDKHMIYPKMFKVGFTFNVIHEHALGNQVVGETTLPRLIKKSPPQGEEQRNSHTIFTFPHEYNGETHTDRSLLNPVTELVVNLDIDDNTGPPTLQELQDQASGKSTKTDITNMPQNQIDHIRNRNALKLLSLDGKL